MKDAVALTKLRAQESARSPQSRLWLPDVTLSLEGKPGLPRGGRQPPPHDLRIRRNNSITIHFLNPDKLNHPMTLPSLPCFPCPHAASCCAYGTTISDEEAEAIQANHGPGLVYRTRWGEWRTRVRKNRCALFRDGGCSIHDQPYYPAMCRGFPWIDADGERYEYDLTICGQFAADPELVAIQRALPLGHGITTVARNSVS